MVQLQSNSPLCLWEKWVPTPKPLSHSSHAPSPTCILPGGRKWFSMLFHFHVAKPLPSPKSPSHLRQLLSDSLGGNAKTLVLTLRAMEGPTKLMKNRLFFIIYIYISFICHIHSILHQHLALSALQFFQRAQLSSAFSLWKPLETWPAMMPWCHAWDVCELLSRFGQFGRDVRCVAWRSYKKMVACGCSYHWGELTMDERSWKIIGVGSISLSDVVWFSRMSDQEIGCSRMYFVAVEDVCKQKVNFLANFLVNFLVNVFLSGITFQYICGEMRSVNLISRGNKEWQGSWRSWRGDDQKPKQSFRFFDAWCGAETT